MAEWHEEENDERWSPQEVKSARYRLGLTLSELAARLRLADPQRNGKDMCRAWEDGKKRITGPAMAAMQCWLDAKKADHDRR